MRKRNGRSCGNVSVRLLSGTYHTKLYMIPALDRFGVLGIWGGGGPIFGSLSTNKFRIFPKSVVGVFLSRGRRTYIRRVGYERGPAQASDRAIRRSVPPL